MISLLSLLNHPLTHLHQAWQTLRYRGVWQSWRDAQQLRPALKRLVGEGGLVVNFPADTDLIAARFVLQPDGDVLLLATPSYLADSAAQATHFSAINAALSSVRNALNALSALFVVGHAVALAGASVVMIAESIRQGEAALSLLLIGVVISLALWIIKQIVLRLALSAVLQR